MKETKTFFDNNRLNKGYAKNSQFNLSDKKIFQKQHLQMLPPIDIMEEYEEIYPGIFAQLIKMAEKEQEHRHKADLLAIESYNKSIRFGKFFALVFIAIIAFVTLFISLFSNEFLAGIFAISAFAVIGFISYIYSKNSDMPKLKNLNRNNNRPNQHHNQNYNRNSNGNNNNRHKFK